MYQTRLSIMSLILVVLALTLVTARSLGWFDNGEMSTRSQIDLLIDVRHDIETRYVNEPDGDDLVESAVRGMVESLDDPYSAFIARDDMSDFDKQVLGEFSGIGAEITVENEKLIIVSPLEDSPAWKAGLMAGDVVLKIDDTPTIEIFAEHETVAAKTRAAIERLTGKSGTTVKLLIRHESGDEATISITRQRIEIPIIKGVRRVGDDGQWDFMLDRANKVGYIKITQFTEKSIEDFSNALQMLVDDGARAVIVDVRFNPGGLLQAAVAIADQFLTGGQTVVSVRGRAVPAEVHNATNKTLAPEIPVVVLGNESSASASEILAGALADNKRAKYIGTRTFGKGSVQTIKMLQDKDGKPQGMLKLTNAYYYLPSGRKVHREPDAVHWGVDPDDGFYVPMTPEQMMEMVKVRREGEILRPHNGDVVPTITPDYIRTEMKDPQMAAGLQAIIGKLATGDWPVVGESGADRLATETRRNNLQRQRNLLADSLVEIDKELARLDKTLHGEGDESDDAADKDEQEVTNEAELEAAAP